MATQITAAMLYNFIECPHRVKLDLSADINLKDNVSPFVQLLWDKSSLHKTKVIDELSISFIDLSGYAGDEKEQKPKSRWIRGNP